MELEVLRQIVDSKSPARDRADKKAKEDEEEAHFSNADLHGLPSQLWTKDSGELTLEDKQSCIPTFMICSLTSELVGKVMNDTHIENHERFLNLWNKNDRDGKGMLTVSNHTHYLDDPMVIVPLFGSAYLDVPKSLYGNTTFFDNLRWIPAEKRNFFFHRNPRLRTIFRDFFGRGKVVPVLRGQGIEQEAFQRLTAKLKEGDWVHTFGEGMRSRTYGELEPFKPGVGYLVKKAPDTIVLPFGHDGMQKVSPFGCKAEVKDGNGKPTKKFLDTGKNIQIVVGEPMNLKDFASKVPDNIEGYLQIAAEIHSEVKKCFDRARKLNDARNS